VINKTHTGMYRGMNVVSNTIKKSDLDELSYDWKANSIRVMIGGTQYTPDGLLRADFDAVLQSELIRMDTLVKWCSTNGLHMNVGLAGLSQGLFDSKAAQTRLINTWKLIATRYKNSTAVWVYDLANEPVVSYTYPFEYKWPLDNNILLWPSLADTLVKAIRAIDAVKPIMIESLNYSINMDDIKPIDASIPNIIYSIHMYVPHLFTHQTLPGWTNTYSYPGEIDGKYYDKNLLRELLRPIKDYQDKYRVPIYIGEFSAIRWAPGNSSFNYIRDCIELFEEYNWDYDYFAFRTWDGWSIEHSTGYHDSILPITKTDRELLLRSYFLQNKTQPAVRDTLTNRSIQNLDPLKSGSFFYPNPVQNNLNFKLSDEYNRLVVSNTAVKRVFEDKVSPNYKLDVSTLNTGVYFLQVENASVILNGKVRKK
jgi:endoglucanase